MSFAESNEECMRYVNIGNYVTKIPDMVSLFDQAFEKYENKKRKEELRNGIKEKMRFLENFLER